MGGGGSIGMMNSVIKNNRKLLKKRKMLKDIKGSLVSSDRVEFKTQNASLHTLSRIKERMQGEQKELRQKQFVIFGFIIAILLSVFFYYI